MLQFEPKLPLPVMNFKNSVVVFITVCLSFQSMVCDAGEIINGFKAMYSNNIMECATEYPVSAEEMLKIIKEHQLPEGDNAKCMLACVFKKIGITDDEGKLAPEGIRQMAQMASAEKPDIVKKSNDFIDACLSVNDEEVSGDNRNCERAALLFQCSVNVNHAQGANGVEA